MGSINFMDVCTDFTSSGKALGLTLKNGTAMNIKKEGVCCTHTRAWTIKSECLEYLCVCLIIKCGELTAVIHRYNFCYFLHTARP